VCVYYFIDICFTIIIYYVIMFCNIFVNVKQFYFKLSSHIHLVIHKYFILITST